MKILSSLTESEKETIDLHLEDLESQMCKFYNDVKNDYYESANEELFFMKRTLNDIQEIVQRTTMR